MASRFLFSLEYQNVLLLLSGHFPSLATAPNPSLSPWLAYSVYDTTTNPDKASGVVDEFAIYSTIFTQVVLNIYRLSLPQQPLSQYLEAEIATHQHTLATPQHIL